jgi:uncharacterized protein (TIGR03435 family)
MKLLAILLIAAAWLAAQPAAVPSFEVASIRPASPDATDFGVDTDPGLLRVEAQTLRDMVRIAFGVNDSQVAGGPKWADSDRFDITGRANGPAGSKELLTMLQNLLADRFKLAIHRETKTAQGFALVVAKGGIKMQKSESTESNSTGGRGRIDAQGVSMSKFAERLNRAVRAPVEDATETPGGFNFTLTWSPDDPSTKPLAPDRPAVGDSNAPSVFTALQEQLGLKLESRKVTMEVIVIDRAEKPDDN